MLILKYMSDNTLFTLSLKCCSSWLDNLKIYRPKTFLTFAKLAVASFNPSEVYCFSGWEQQHKQGDRHQYPTLEPTPTATSHQCHDTKKPSHFFFVYKNYHQPFRFPHFHSYQPTKKNTKSGSSRLLGALPLLGVRTSASSISMGLQIVTVVHLHLNRRKKGSLLWTRI